MFYFLIIDFKIVGRVENRNSFQKTLFLKASFFYTFKLRHAIIRRQYSVGWIPLYSQSGVQYCCPQLNGDTLISLYAVLLMLERVWTLLPQFSTDVKVTHAQDTSSVMATNKLKSKVLKNNIMNGKRRSKRCLYVPRATKSLSH